MVARTYQLKKGTILDDRYELGRVLGEGGFGITYEGNNLLTQTRVAIKEFFCRDYMDRNAGETDEAVLFAPDFEERFRKDKDRFLKEARTLRDFDTEEGVVHVIDYFEVNGTAYIVMPYLEGMTLREHVARHGRMDPETLFRKLKPLLHVLGRIHRSGLIHRDISPDNIMMLTDGSLCLIDFGAANRYDRETKTYSVICKNGYAPPEQYREGSLAGPTADIYALAATIYYCLTSADPESSLQRILLDELKMPSLIGIPIPGDAERIVQKGLAIRPRDRWQSAEEMLAAIENIYPEKDNPKVRRKRIVLTAVLIAAAAVIAMLIPWYLRHRTEIRFRSLETAVVWLTDSVADAGGAVQPPDGNRAGAEAAKARLEAFAGKDNYLWKETGGGIRMEFPAELLCGEDPEIFCRRSICGPVKYDLSMEPGEYTTTIENVRNTALPLEYADLRSVTIEEGEIGGIRRSAYDLPEAGNYRYLCIELTDEAAEKFRLLYDGVREAGEPVLLTEGAVFRMYRSMDVEKDSSLYYTAVSRGDGKIFDLIPEHQTDAFIQLLYYDLTHDEPDYSFDACAEWTVHWENVETALFTGKNQRNITGLGDDVLYYRYSTIPLEFSQANVHHNIIVMKNRLDSLRIPYAIGILPNSKEEIVVAAKNGDLWGAAAISLGEKDNALCVGTWFSSAFLGTACASDNPLMTLITDDGAPCIEFRGLTNQGANALPRLLPIWEEEGTGTLYLTFSAQELPLARISLSDLEKAYESEVFDFYDLCIEDLTAEDFAKSAFPDYLAVFGEEDPAMEMFLTGVRAAKNGEHPPVGIPFDELVHHPYEEQIAVTEALRSRIALYGGTVTMDIDSSGTSCDIRLECHLPEKDFAEEVLSIAEEICRAPAFCAGLFGQVELVLWRGEGDAVNLNLVFRRAAGGESGGRMLADSYDLQATPGALTEQEISELNGKLSACLE